MSNLVFRRRAWFYWLVGVFALFSLAVYVFKPGGVTAVTILSNVIAVGAAAIAFSASAVASRRHDARPPMAWLLLTIGLGLYLLGEVSWGIQEAILGIKVPFPSVADVFWVTGYVPLFLGLTFAWRQLGVGLRVGEIVTIGVGAAAATAAAARFLLIPIALSLRIGPAEKGLDIIYPVADIVLFIPALALTLILGRSLLGRPWRLICVGLVLLTVADFTFAYLSWHQLYWATINQPGNFIDLVWVAGYLAIGLGAFGYARLMSGQG